MILDEIREQLKKTHADYISGLTISDVSVGLYMVAVQLSDGSVGVASIIPDQEIHCSKKDRDFGEFTPMQILGREVTDLLDSTRQTTLVHTLQVAALNAISSRLIAEGDYNLLHNSDPVDLLKLDAGLQITIVGAFQSYIRRIAASSSQLKVLELNEMALMPKHRQYFVPADQYAEVLPESDIVIITGLTLTNSTLDQLLGSCRPDATIVITGPSGSILPDVLFSHNVSLIGATRITRPELLLPLVRQGAAGYHLFKYCAEKICLLTDLQKPQSYHKY